MQARVSMRRVCTWAGALDPEIDATGTAWCALKGALN